MSQAPSKYALRVQRRAIIFALIVVVIMALYSWLKNFLKDPYDNPTDTRDMIVAVKQGRDGAQLVTLTTGGQEKPCPGYVEGKTDKDPVWRPDGNIIAFLTDRDEGAFLVHRWSLGADQQERRTTGTRSFTSAYFGPMGDNGTELLATQGGQVFALNLRENLSRTILPPTDAQNTSADSNEGTVSSFQSMYDKYGKSFKNAKWFGDHSAVVAVMKRDNGEVLIIQSLVRKAQPDGSQRSAPPVAVVAGDRVDFDLSASGKLVATVQGFQFPDPDQIPPQFIKDGKVTPPYKNGVLFLDVNGMLSGGQQDAGGGMVMASQSDDDAFGRPRISPDGSSMVILGGTSAGDQFTPKAIVKLPVGQATQETVKVVKPGEIMSVEWHPSGEKLVFIERKDGKAGIYTITPTGADLQKVSDSADYLSASFSPQLQKP